MFLRKLYALRYTRSGYKSSIVAFVRHKSITGYDTADNALQKVTGGRINRWLDAYEDFVGLTEVRLAQEYVTKVSSGNFLTCSISFFPVVLVEKMDKTVIYFVNFRILKDIFKLFRNQCLSVILILYIS